MNPKSTKSRRLALATRLREARLAAGLNQSQAAKLLRRPQSFVSRCESGNHRIDVFELGEFARIYDKPISLLLEGIQP